MGILESVAQGFRAIFENKLRSFLTLLGITIGVASVLAMVSISDGARQIVIQDIEKLGGSASFSVVRARWIRRGGRWMRNSSAEYITYDDVLAIERECPSVAHVVPRVAQWGGVPIRAGRGYTATETRAGYQGTTPSFTEALEWYTDEGRFFEEEEMVDWDKVAVIGYSVAVELFGEDADPIGQQITVNGQRYTIVGIMEPRGTSIQYGWNLDQTVIIPLTTAQKRFQGSDEIPMIQVQAVSTEKILDAMAEVERVLLKRHRNEQFYQIWAPGTQNLEFVTKLSKMLRVVLGGIAGFSLLVGGIGIMNIMLVSVTERTREIGLRKALGAKRRDILVQFLIEATVLCLVGGFIGLSLGLGFGYGSAKIMSNPSIGGFIGGLLGFRGDWVAWPFEVPIPWTIISIGVSVAIGVFFGLYPAWKASRLTPIEALRHT